MTTVREASFEAMRAAGLTTIFSNPGSTEVPFLVDLPPDIRFVLALHEGSVVGIATGHALGTGHAALALLHTTAGLGNAVGAIATARVNHAPLVIVVGQQDRRHLALEPFLTGNLRGLAGGYPLDVLEPARAADVPSAIRRAAHRAEADSGPVLVIVPMGDWDQEHEPDAAAAAVRSASGPRSAPPEVIGEITRALGAAQAPAIVAGAGNDTEAGWAALVRLAELLGAPVWQEAFGGRPGFPQQHPLFVGHLPADRPRLHAALAGRDALLVVGTAALRQYPFSLGRLMPENTGLYVITADGLEAHRSPATLALVADPAAALTAMVAELEASGHVATPSAAMPPKRADDFALPAPADGESLRAAHLFQALAARLPEDTVLVEESPSSRPALEALLPARHPFGFVSAAMGGLGFGLPAAIGLRMAMPARPVVAVIGDGSSMYSIQALWTAAHEGVGVLFIVPANGGYAVMDRLADQRGGRPPWPSFGELSVATLAEGFGVETERIRDIHALTELLDRVVPGLATRQTPLLIEVAIVPDTDFAP